MLAVSRVLNPGCGHHLGDMRNLRLAERFDAVIVHNAIDYMTTEADLSAGFTTAARLFEWAWDPDPADTWAQTEYVFMLRHADGSVTRASESHRHGLFPESTWVRLLTDAGFTPRVLVEETDEDRQPRTLFLAQRLRCNRELSRSTD